MADCDLDLELHLASTSKMEDDAHARVYTLPFQMCSSNVNRETIYDKPLGMLPSRPPTLDKKQCKNLAKVACHIHVAHCLYT